MVATLKPSEPLTPDTRLVGEICTGDDAAFYSFYRRHAQYIAGVAYRLLGNNSDVDDIVQDTFVTASQKLMSLKEPEYARLWLVKIAVRHSQKRLRSRTRTHTIQKAVESDIPRKTDMQISSMLEDLREVLRKIPSKLGEPWILHKLEGLTIKEVSTACGISIATVKRRIASADKKVQKKVNIHV